VQTKEDLDKAISYDITKPGMTKKEKADAMIGVESTAPAISKDEEHNSVVEAANEALHDLIVDECAMMYSRLDRDRGVRDEDCMIYTVTTHGAEQFCTLLPEGVDWPEVRRRITWNAVTHQVLADEDVDMSKHHHGLKVWLPLSRSTLKSSSIGAIDIITHFHVAIFDQAQPACPAIEMEDTGGVWGPATANSGGRLIPEEQSLTIFTDNISESTARSPRTSCRSTELSCSNGGRRCGSWLRRRRLMKCRKPVYNTSTSKKHTLRDCRGGKAVRGQGSSHSCTAKALRMRGSCCQ